MVRGGLPAWWWFENSRAYLYYFFIVNDCQSIVGSPCFGEWPGGLKDGGVFVRCAFPYKAIVNFLVRVVFGSLHGFFVEGSILAQDEAGGVLNTCKSNGIPGVRLRVRVANG